MCDLGFGGHDCSKLVPTFPPPFTNKPTGPTTPVPDAGLTPSNTYIRKYSVFSFVFFVQDLPESLSWIRPGFLYDIHHGGSRDVI